MKKLEFELGVYDDPKNQKQPIFILDLLKSNIAVFGGAMSGKTTFVKTLIVRLHEKTTSKTENIYIVDFSGRLSKYKNLGFVCACFDSTNEENVKRLFNRLEDKLREHSKTLKDSNFIEYEGDKKPPHVTFILENFNAFLSDKRYFSYQDKLLKLCREGLSKGITIILTMSDTSGGVNQYTSTFGQKISFEMPKEKIIDIFNGKTPTPMNNQGRGIVNISNLTYEFQCFLPFENEEEELVDFKGKYAHCRNNLDIIGSFDGELTTQNITKFSQPSSEELHEYVNPVTLGLDYYKMQPVKIDLSTNSCIGIYGKRCSGKTNLLWIIIKEAIKLKNDHGLRFVLLDDGRKQLKNFPAFIQANSTKVDIREFTKTSELKEFLFNGYVDTKKPNVMIIEE